MDTEKFESKVKALYNDLFSMAIKLTKDRNDAEDLVQESITKAFKNIHQFIEGSNFRAWIFKILYNDFITLYRKRKRRRKTVIATDDWIPILSSKAEKEHIESSLMMKELEELIQTMDTTSSVPFMLYYLGYAYKEIAEDLGLPIGTVKSRIFYARKFLQENIKEIYGGYPLTMAA